jgi:hypothetical protein
MHDFSPQHNLLVYVLLVLSIMISHCNDQKLIGDSVFRLCPLVVAQHEDMVTVLNIMKKSLLSVEPHSKNLSSSCV